MVKNLLASMLTPTLADIQTDVMLVAMSSCFASHNFAMSASSIHILTITYYY